MERVKQAIASGDLFAKYVGIELIEADKGYARVKMVIKDHHLNGAHIVHGGAIFTLADYAFALAANSEDRVAIGINASIVYAQAVNQGILFAEAKEISSSYKLGNYLVTITDDNNNVVATYQGTAYRKTEKW